MAFSEWFESVWAKKVEYPTFCAVGSKDVSEKHKRKHKAEKFLNNWDEGSIKRWDQSLETSVIISFSKGNRITAYYIDLFIEVLDAKNPRKVKVEFLFSDYFITTAERSK